MASTVGKGVSRDEQEENTKNCKQKYLASLFIPPYDHVDDNSINCKLHVKRLEVCTEGTLLLIQKQTMKKTPPCITFCLFVVFCSFKSLFVS